KQNAALLVNWEAAPPPDRPWSRDADVSLRFLDGASCWKAAGGSLAASLEALKAEADLPPPAAREPLQDFLARLRPGTLLVVVATADVDSAAEAEHWERCELPPEVEAVALLLPSLARSDLAAQRRSSAKLRMLARLGG